MNDAPLSYEDPQVCAGVHSWTYEYRPDDPDEAWRMIATCVDCARVENRREHLDRKATHSMEAFQRVGAAWLMSFHEASAPLRRFADEARQEPPR